MRALKILLVVIVILLAATGAAIEMGLYNVAADHPHWRVTRQLLTQVRERSIEVRSQNLTVPDLSAPQLVATGAGHYAEMCTGCHLAPGMDSSELREGLYPKPPVLYKTGIDDPREAFWIIKHGIKMTAMPAWGKSHSDQAIWAIVAFLKKLPSMTPAQYQAITAKSQTKDGDGQD